MGNRVAEPFRILIVEPDQAACRTLFDLVQGVGVTSKVETVSALNEVAERFYVGEYTLCLFGPTIGALERQHLLLGLRDGKAERNTLLVVTLRREEAKLASSMRASGADVVLVEPFQVDALKEFLHRSTLGAPAGANDSEQITSLPWILHSVASRLRTIAHRLEAEEASGERYPANPKVVKEALLGAIGSNTDDELLDEIRRSVRGSISRSGENGS